MKLSLNKFTNAIGELRNLCAPTYSSSLKQDEKDAFEFTIELIEADMKENIVDMLVLKAEFTAHGKTNEITLEIFDIGEGKKPNLIHVQKKELI